MTEEMTGIRIGITDQDRLTWLIDEGAYSYVDHDEYWNLNEIERQEAVRNRIDVEIRKKYEQKPPQTGS